jgi:hypothetical protein
MKGEILFYINTVDFLKICVTFVYLAGNYRGNIRENVKCAEVCKQTFVKVCKSYVNPQILWLIQLSQNFLGLPVRKSQIRKFV